MKKITAAGIAAGIALLICIAFAACTKDSGYKMIKIYTPVYKPSAAVRAAIKTSAPVDIANAGKMLLYKQYIFLNEVNRGIHVIDNSNPSAPVNKAFIPIPGNLDISAKGDVLYADCFTDLLALDISHLDNISFKTYLPGIFPERAWILNQAVPEGQFIVDWKVRDTTVELPVIQGQGIWRNNEYYSSGPVIFYNDQAVTPASSSGGKSNNGGIAGSTSRFAITGNYLYTVSSSQLSAINVTNPSSPLVVNTGTPYTNAQTIFPFKNKLFIGGSNGFSIFSLADPSNPQPEGVFGHFCSNDPIIADDSIAYVTLHTGNACEGTIDELEVMDITNINSPAMIKAYPLSSPNGLSKDGNLLFICDAKDGLKIFNATNPHNITLLKTIAINTPYDVICVNKTAFVSAKGGLYQLDYSDINHIKQLSKIALR